MKRSGVIPVCKPAGITSFGVVARLKRILGIKKIGHTGTLDPEATGVLPICVGRATGLVESLMDHDKTYRASLRFGLTTDTQDIWGTLLSEGGKVPDEEAVRAAIPGFVGNIKQVPPMYSAKKVQGKKLYELARKGIEVHRQPVPVTIHDISIEEMNLPEMVITVRCSKGTYIRTLINDLGESLGSGAVMTSLCRTATGEFRIEETFGLDEIEKMTEVGDDSFLIPIDHFYRDLPGYTLREDMAKLLENGAPLSTELVGADTGDRIRIYHPDGRFGAIYRIRGPVAKLEKYYLE